MNDCIFDRKLQGDYINKKLKELDSFCKSNGIDCTLSFGGGFESRSRFETDENGKFKIVSDGPTRTYTSIQLKIILTDSDKGDNVKFLDSIMQMLLDNIQPRSKDEIPPQIGY